MLGAAFKPDTDDVRDSPALNVAAALHLRGAAVSVYDPEALETARRLFPTLGYADDLDTAVADADAVLLLTEWAAFRELDPQRLAALVARALVIDARNCLDATRWQAAGWEVVAMGRTTPPVVLTAITDEEDEAA